MPPKKVEPAIVIETFSVKKRSYTRKKKDLTPEVTEVTEKISHLVLDSQLPPEPEVVDSPPPPIKRTQPVAHTQAHVHASWEDIDWSEELGSAILSIDCRVAIPFAGKDLINVQYFTANAMNPTGFFSLPYRIDMPGTRVEEAPATSLEIRRYAFAIHPQVIVRYEISHRGADLTWGALMNRVSLPPLVPGYHASQFFYRSRVVSPKFVILYKGRYVQLPKLQIQGIYTE